MKVENGASLGWAELSVGQGAAIGKEEVVLVIHAGSCQSGDEEVFVVGEVLFR